MKIRIGVLGTADIARRRMIPAILQSDQAEYAGVATAAAEEWQSPGPVEDPAAFFKKKEEKAGQFAKEFGGKYYRGYEAMLADSSIDAVYIPLPPALHYRWAMKALEYGKHVLLEKPFTTRLEDTRRLAECAEKKKLVLFENYGFCYHSQMKRIRQLLEEGAVGELRLVRAAFGFPHRDPGDFRYSGYYGGGALFDCGGYVLKAAREFMTEEVQIKTAALVRPNGYEVDLYGSATLQDEACRTAQVSFGMDNGYKCELELWGSRGMILSPRVFTAPAGMSISLKVSNQEGVREITVPGDDQFGRALAEFTAAVRGERSAEAIRGDILRQSVLTEEVIKAAGYEPACSGV